MNKKIIIGFGAFAAITIAVIIINIFIAYQEKSNFLPTLPPANTSSVKEKVVSKDKETNPPQEDYETNEQDSQGQPFLLN